MLILETFVKEVRFQKSKRLKVEQKNILHYTSFYTTTNGNKPWNISCRVVAIFSNCFTVEVGVFSVEGQEKHNNSIKMEKTGLKGMLW